MQSYRGSRNGPTDLGHADRDDSELRIPFAASENERFSPCGLVHRRRTHDIVNNCCCQWAREWARDGGFELDGTCVVILGKSAN